VSYFFFKFSNRLARSSKLSAGSSGLFISLILKVESGIVGNIKLASLLSPEASAFLLLCGLCGTLKSMYETRCFDGESLD